MLAPRHAGTDVAPSVAPGAPELGVMLPYSPLHHPAARRPRGRHRPRDDERQPLRRADRLPRRGRDRAAGHDRRSAARARRPIQTRTDDSVVRAVDAPGRRRRVTFRRSRGYVPASLPLPDACERPILACGAELKSTFCFAHGKMLGLSHHIGDLENYETLRSFTDGVAHFERLLRNHPGRHSPRPASRVPVEQVRARPRGGAAIGVQHHHATSRPAWPSTASREPR